VTPPEPAPPAPDRARLAEIAGAARRVQSRHWQYGGPTGNWCACGLLWPCDTADILAALRAAEAGREQKDAALAEAGVILAALRLSVAWELAPEVMAEIHRVEPLVRAALGAGAAAAGEAGK
jgi:hypothetical protein